MIRIAPLSRRLLASVGIVFVASIVLTGCANPVEKLIESATSSATDSALSELTGVDVETAEIPADFPDGVPLPDAKPQVALSQTNDGQRSWIIHFEEGVDDQVFDDLKAAYISNGYIEETSSDMADAMRLAVFVSDEYSVNASLLGNAEDGQILQMMVFEVESP